MHRIALAGDVGVRDRPKTDSIGVDGDSNRCDYHCCHAAVMIISRIKSPEKTAEATLYLIKAGSIIRLVTIMSIVFAVSVLCALGPIKGDAAVATLSAIAGYVLGNERAARIDRREEKSGPSAPV